MRLKTWGKKGGRGEKSEEIKRVGQCRIEKMRTPPIGLTSPFLLNTIYVGGGIKVIILSSTDM